MTKVALLACEPPGEVPGFWTNNYAATRVLAELLRAVPGVEARLFGTTAERVHETTEAVIQFSPDVVGCSAYVWSFPKLLSMAREIKRHRPDTTVVFGGPSARVAMFAIERYRASAAVVDALVEGPGERVFCQIAELPARDVASLASLPGVSVRAETGFLPPRPAPPVDLDALASPYDLGLIEASHTALLETFRGCPLACRFCQWGSAPSRPPAFSSATIARALRCIAALEPKAIHLIDAGINLSAVAFRNLVDAEREVRVFERIPLSFEVLPSHLNEEHLRFLGRIRLGNVGVGLQSYEPEVMRQMQRRLDAKRTDEVVRALTALGADVCVGIIFGLPFDSPDTFLRTLDRALGLGCSVRVFPCLALPDALMTRPPEGADIRFDPETLRVTACAGWTAADLERTSARIDSLAPVRRTGANMPWSFERAALAESDNEKELAARVTAHLTAMSGGAWKVGEVRRMQDGLLVSVSTDGGEVTLDIRPHRAGAPAFVVAGDLSLSYRGSPPAPVLRALQSSAARLLPGFGPLLALHSRAGGQGLS